MPNWLDAELLRSGEGNPNHKGSGPGGGQFTSGPGGAAGSKPHGKHWAKRQKKKGKLKKGAKKLVARHAKERAELRREHLDRLKGTQNREDRAKLREQYKAERTKRIETHSKERESFVAKARESLAKPHDLASAERTEVAKTHEEMSTEWRKSLDKTERAALEGYTGSKFQAIQSVSRFGEIRAKAENTTSKAEAQGLIAKMDQAMKKASLDKARVVYRGVSNIKSIGLNPNKLVGATINDKGFLSTSLTPKVAEGFSQGKGAAMIKILAPKGAKGASLGGITMLPTEREVLFARDSKLKIVKATKNKDGSYLLHAKISHGEGIATRADMATSRSLEDSRELTHDSRDRLESRFGWAAGDVQVTHPE